MRCRASISIVLALGLAAGATRAETAPPVPGTRCVADFRALAAELRSKYAEVPVSAGLERDGSLVSVFASSKTGSWTIVMSRPRGPSCVVAAGKAWQIEPRLLGPEV